MAERPDPGESPLVELQTLFPIGGVVDVKNPSDGLRVRVRVRALSAKEWSQTLAGAMNIVEGLAEGKSYVQIVADNFDAVLELAAVATDQKADFLGSLEGGDFLDVVVGIIGANENFFRKGADLVLGKVGKRIRAIVGAGRIASSTSPQTASPTP